MRSPLTVAVVQPVCVPADLAANAAEHGRAVREADARLVVFPELSLSGYDLGVPAVDVADDVFAPIVEACSQRATTALVGAAVLVCGARFIAALAVTGDGVTVAYCKTYLGGDEGFVFSPGAGPRRVDIGDWRVGVGICKDTRILDHVDGTLALGTDLYVAGLVHHAAELEDQDGRAARIIERGGLPVAFASAAGCVGSNYPDTAGHSCIWAADGAVLARCTRTPGEIARASLRP